MHIAFIKELIYFNGFLNELKIINCQFPSNSDMMISEFFLFNTSTLSISDSKLNFINEETFANYYTCHTLILLNIAFQNDDGLFLSKFHETLTVLWVWYVPKNLYMDIMFGYRSYWNISSLVLRSNSPNFRVLAPSNFSYFPHLQKLDISASGVEFIMPDTFKYVSNTLTELLLMQNRLKSVECILFPFIEHTSQNKGAFLSLMKNNITCDCAFYQLRNIIDWNLNYIQPKNLYIRISCAADITNVAHNVCHEIQKIKTDKICRIGDGRVYYAYTKFTIRKSVMENQIILNGPPGSKYRLFAFSITNSFGINSQENVLENICLRKGTPEIENKCLLLKNATESIDLDDIALASITTFCINYVSGCPKRFWPLHCVTYNSSSKAELSYSPLFIILFTLLSLIAILIGCSFSKSFGKKSLDARYIQLNLNNWKWKSN